MSTVMQRAEVKVVRSRDTGYRPTLEKLMIESDAPAGRGVVHLTPDQALYVQSRLSAIASAFLRARPGSVQHYGVEQLPENHEQSLSRCGAKVWPIYHKSEGGSAVLDEVVIESEHPDGYGLVHLMPHQARYVHDRLTAIALDYLHEYGWGGEDGRAQ